MRETMTNVTITATGKLLYTATVIAYKQGRTLWASTQAFHSRRSAERWLSRQVTIEDLFPIEYVTDIREGA